MAAKAEKGPKTGKWLIQYRYTDRQEHRKKSMKRGFTTKREAEEHYPPLQRNSTPRRNGCLSYKK